MLRGRPAVRVRGIPGAVPVQRPDRRTQAGEERRRGGGPRRARLSVLNSIPRAKKRRAGLVLACAGMLSGGHALAGHGVVFTPSYYPQEITIATVDSAAAGAQLRKITLPAYIGATPRFAAGVPKELKPVESLETVLVPR